MFLKGFRFGLLLQFAVGPVCLYVVSVASVSGFSPAAAAVLGVTVADAIYILAALIGIVPLKRLEKHGNALRIVSALVIALFGIWMLLSAVLPVLSGVSRPLKAGIGGAFLSAFLLTLSNPLTIGFWAGVFASKTAGEAMEKHHLALFASGSLLSTPAFLVPVAFVGALLGGFLPGFVIRVMNALVGAVLIVLGVKVIFGGKKKRADGPADTGR
jgi:threonine/homoserine/homoserine lactone efflux protein